MEWLIVHLECHHSSVVKPKKAMSENMASYPNFSTLGRDWDDMRHWYEPEVFRGSEMGMIVADCGIP